MKKRISVVVCAAFIMLACASFAVAQEQYPDVQNAKPMFVAGPNHMELAPKRPAANLTQWNGTFTDLTHRTINFTMVGNDPSTGVASTIPVYIIPIKMVYPANNGNKTFDPATATVQNGLTVVNNIIASPIFDSGVNFTQGNVNLGTTQYIDAYQRGNFWKFVKKKANRNYHVLLGTPTVLAEQTITVNQGQGSVVNNPFASGLVGTYDINLFDSNLQKFMKSFSQVNPGVLPLFVTYDVFLTSGGCCIGGYHNANGAQPGGQTYSHATYVDQPGSFSQDVSALSHEIGEWMDDPFVDNRVNCNDNSIMENGDPLEGRTNYGGFPYSLNGFTYNLQSLVFIGYFGGPKADSVHKWLSFQNDETHVCPGQ
jgi:hypothetical protein